MTPAEWIASGASGLTLLLTGAGVIFSHGRTSERVAHIETRVKAHDDKIDGMEKAFEGAKRAIDLLAQKIESLAERWTAEQKVAAVELARVADAIKSGHDLINARLDGMEKFSRAELEQVKHDLRGVKQAVSGLEPAAGRARVGLGFSASSPLAGRTHKSVFP